MKIDIRNSDQRSLLENFQEYQSSNSLIGWYRFYSQDQSISFIDLVANSLGDAVHEVVNTQAAAKQINSSPYVARLDLNSVKLTSEGSESIRIENLTSPNPWDVKIPFTIAMWAKLPAIGSNVNNDKTLLLSKTKPQNASYGFEGRYNDFYLTYKHSIKRFEFQISGSMTGPASSFVKIAGGSTTLAPTIEPDKWFHVAVTFDSTGSVGSSLVVNCIKMYLNGNQCNTDSNTETFESNRTIPAANFVAAGQSIPSGFTPVDFNGDLFIGKKLDPPSGTPNPNNFSDVTVHELAIWNKALEPIEIQTIWKSAVLRISSGIISESPRNILKTWDSANAYPYIKLPGDQRRLGNSQIAFDDFARTRVFQSANRKLEVKYPIMIPDESPVGIGSKGAYASPNILPDLIVRTGDGASEYAAFRSAYDGTDTTFGIDSYSPFTDSRVDDMGEDDYFVIPIIIGKESILTRCSNTGSASPYQDFTSTGVFYYSPSLNAFNRIGDRDPVTEALIYTGSGYSTDNENLTMASKMLSIFHAQDADPFRLHDGNGTNSLSGSIASRYLTASFSNIGQPTNRYGGVANKRLYAISDNLFEMSRYINSPFVITSANIVLSCSVEKRFDGDKTPGYPTDAYTVFMMRQAGPAAKGKPVAGVVSSSYRELISFKSVLTYNQDLKYKSIYTSESRTFSIASSSISNLTDFASVVNFNVNPTTVQTKVVPLTVNFDLTPRVAPVSLISTAIQQNCPPSMWGGSTSNLGQRHIINFDSAKTYLPQGISSVVSSLAVKASSTQQEFQGFNADSSPSGRMQFPYAPAKKNYNPDEKAIALANLGHISSSYHINTAIENLTSEYLLLPTDKLIFGINTLHSSPDGEVLGSGGTGKGFTFSSGSMMKLPQQEAKLIIRGRYLKNNEKYHTSLPQQLTTAAVHESLHYDNPVLDQHEVSIRSEFLGSLRAQLITGSMTTPDAGWPRASITDSTKLRQVIDDASSQKVFGSDVLSIKRNLRITDTSEIYFDSLVPDVKELWRADGYQITASYDSGVFTERYHVAKGGSAPVGRNNKWLHRFPFESRYNGIRRISKEERATEQKIVLYDFTSQSSVFDSRRTNAASATIYSAAENFIEAVQKVVGTQEKNFNLGLFGTKFQPAMSVQGRNVVLFGIGDGPEGLFLPVEPSRAVSSTTMFTVQKPRGFKYGLIDANPKPTSAVFRSTRYGQLRDMLEQRQYTALFDYETDFYPALSTPTKSPFGIAKKSKVPKTRISNESAITIRFRTPVHENPTATNVSVLPSLTSGSNLSLYATSSLPYFDDITTNRDYP